MLDELPPLSDRELEVLKLVATGATNQQIARDLVISPNTVKVHLRNIFEKLGVGSRTEATMEAVRRGLVYIEGAGELGLPVGAGAAAGAADGGAAGSPAEPEAVAPAAPPIALWQRVYLGAAALAVVLTLFLPGWWQGRSAARPLSTLTDAGRAQVAPVIRSDVARWTARAPLPEARSRLALVALGSKLYAIGGETGTGITPAVTIYDTTSNGWLPGARKPTPVSNVSGVVLDGKIFVPGGSVAAGSVGTPGSASQVGGEPTSLTPPATRESLQGLSPLSGGASGSRSTGTAAAGSRQDTRLQAVTPPAAQGNLFQSPPAPVTAHQVTSAVEVYDPATDSWSAVASLPAPRAGYALTVLDNRIYLFGGWDGTRYCADTFIFDGDTGAWSTGAPLPAPRAFFGAAALKGLIYVAGGYDGQRELSSAAVYDPRAGGPAGRAWSAIAPLSQPRAGLGLLALANRLYAIGGGWNAPLGFNEQYDIASGAWSRSDSPITEQWRNLGLALLNDRVYAVGGWGGAYLATNEEYQAIYRVLIPVGQAP